MDSKEVLGSIVALSKNRKFQIILTAVLLLTIIIVSSQMRVQNIPLLKDVTTGEYIPVALDPFYFLRAADAIIQNSGHIPAIDPFRYPIAPTKYTTEILPRAIAYIYYIANVFGDYSLRYIDIISPVILYILGLIVFFFLCLSLTKSKIASVISSLFLAIIPSYLYRTTAGFADHEAIGMLAFFAVLLAYSFSMEKIEKLKGKKQLYYSAGLAAITALMTVFTLASWGGIANFVLMILPLSSLILWVIRTKDNRDTWKKYLVFYASWIFLSILFGPIFGIGFKTVIGKMMSSTGLVSLFVLGFIIVDSIVKNFNIISKKPKEFYNTVLSFVVTLVLGGIALIAKGDLINEIRDLLVKVQNPFDSAGVGRLGRTVAENAQPYLKDWMSQTGQIFFWISLVAILLFGIYFFQKVKNLKNKIIASLLWVLFVVGVIFSRFSASSTFNGNNFISKFFYFGSAIFFFGWVVYLYYKNDLEIGTREIFIFSWMVLMLIAARGAVRLFFAITPFFCFMVGWAIVYIFKSIKFNKKGDDLVKLMGGLLLIIIVLASVFSAYNLYATSSSQAANVGPSAGQQWQLAMQWIRDNTPIGSVFIHWWDYGYWVQTLGERPTVTDGGHAAGDAGDHYIGRYVLTTPWPNSALSYMKANNVSYLLIDPTDIGKYPAYSSIGTGNNVDDRYSNIPTGLTDPTQTSESSNETLRIYVNPQNVYNGKSYVMGTTDADIIYTEQGNKIFLPAGNTFLAAILIGTNKDQSSIHQPNAIFIYNDRRYSIPLRYIYYQGQIIDFGAGIDSLVQIIPSVKQASNGQMGFDVIGSVLYLSAKAKDSLFAQLYLMDDPYDSYPTINTAHFEDDPFVAYVKAQGLGNIGDFIYYGDIRGPIKIWKVDYPANTVVYPGFLKTHVETFGDMDEYFE